MPDSKYVPPLDGVRGAAALLVSVGHLTLVGYAAIFPVQGSGAFGVLLFFVLSGFLMGHLYLSTAPSYEALQRFIIARLARVLPLYLLMVTVCFVASRVIGQDFPFYFTPVRYLRQITLTAGEHVFWTIPPEIEFYLLFALAWWMLYNQWLSKLAPLIVCLSGLLLFFKPVMQPYLVFSQLHIFTIGVLAAVIRARMTFDKWSLRSALAIQVGGLLLLALVLMGIVPIKSGLLAPHRFLDEQFYTNFPLCLMFGALILAYSIPTGFANALFANPVARQLGACSFSLYLLHEPVMAAVRPLLFALHLPPVVSILLAVAAALGVAMLSHRFIERPLQRLSRDRMTDWANHFWPTNLAVQAGKARA